MRRNGRSSTTAATGGGRSSSGSSLDALSGGALGRRESDDEQHEDEAATMARPVPDGRGGGAPNVVDAHGAAEEDGESASELGEGRRASSVQSAGQSSVHGMDRQAAEGPRPQPRVNTAAAIAAASAASASATATTSLIAAGSKGGGRRRVRSMPLDEIDDVDDDDDYIRRHSIPSPLPSATSQPNDTTTGSSNNEPRHSSLDHQPSGSHQVTHAEQPQQTTIQAEDDDDPHNIDAYGNPLTTTTVAAAVRQRSPNRRNSFGRGHRRATGSPPRRSQAQAQQARNTNIRDRQFSLPLRGDGGGGRNRKEYSRTGGGGDGGGGRRPSNDDEYDPIRRQSMGGSYGLAAAAFATSARNLTEGDSRTRFSMDHGGVGSGGNDGFGGRKADLNDRRRVHGRATSMDNAAAIARKASKASKDKADEVPRYVGRGRGGGTSGTGKRHSGPGEARQPNMTASALIRSSPRRAQSSRAVLGSYLQGGRSYGDGLSDSDDEEVGPQKEGGGGPRRSAAYSRQERRRTADSILEAGEEEDDDDDSSSPAGGGALDDKASQDDVSDLEVPDAGDGGSSVGDVSLWERGQRASGKNLPKRPSQTRLDPLGDMGVPYVPRRGSSSVDDAAAANHQGSGSSGANADWAVGDVQAQAKVNARRRPSSFRRWSSDTEGSAMSFSTNDVGAALQTGKVSRTPSFLLRRGDSQEPPRDDAAKAVCAVARDMNDLDMGSRHASLESGSNGAPTLQRVGGWTKSSLEEDKTTKGRRRSNSIPSGMIDSASLAIPESEAVVPPPSSNKMPAPRSPLRRGGADDGDDADDSMPTSLSTGGSAYLPDVGIVSISAASAKGIMQGQNLAVLDLTTGRHFGDRRSRSIAFVAPSYNQRLPGRPSMGQKSRSNGTVSSSSSRFKRSASIGGNHSQSTFGSSRKSIVSSSSSSSRFKRSASISGNHSQSTFGSSHKSSIDTRKSPVSLSKRGIGSVHSGSDESSIDIMRDRDADATTKSSGASVRRSSVDTLDASAASSCGSVHSDPSNTLNRPMANINTRAMADAPLPVLEEFDLGEQDISLDDDVRGPYHRRSSLGSQNKYTKTRSSGTVSASSIASRSVVYSGLDPSEVEEERLGPRSLRYLPQLLRESYACPSVAVRHRASMVSSDGAEKAGAAAAAAIELRMRLRRPRALPECRDVKGTVLFLDVSGFTALGERLKKKLGDSEGAAEFAHRVDIILSTMVEHVYDCGGDVLMFAGDALICLFDEKPLDQPVTDVESDGQPKRTSADSNAARRAETISRVRSCCIKVFASSSLDKDFIIHGGASHGVVHCYYLGRQSTRPGDCTFVVSGTPLRAAGHLLNKADRGEILIDGIGEPITKKLAVVEVSKSFGVLKQEAEELPNLPNFVRRKSWKLTAELLSEIDDDSDTADELIQNHDVHPLAKAYLGSLAARRSDQAQDGMSILLNELRPVAIVFAGLHDLNTIDARDAVLLRKMNGVFVSMSRITHSCDGAVKEMSFDDKGCVFISVFGAHSHGTNPCFDATMCAMRMQDALKKLEFSNFSLGVSFGDCFCGEVGPEIRADYVVMGTEVNTAARLMGKAPNQGILVSKRIFSNSKKYISFLKSEKIKVKGIDEPFHAYVPQDRIVQTNIVEGTKGGSQPFVLMPSRQFDLKTMITAVDGVLQGRPKTVLVCGGPFLGKSRMIQELNSRATARGFTVLQSFRTSLDCFTSYFPFRQITMTALKKCAECVSNSEEDFESEAKAVNELLSYKTLSKTDRMMLGSIIPSISDSQLISLLPKNPKTMTKAIVDSLIKVLKPLQPVMLVFEGDGEIDPSSWSLISELMLRAVKQCPRLMFVISSRSAPAVPSAMTTSLSDDIVHVKLTPFERYETEIYLKVLLDVREKGIGIDEKMLDAVHHRANGCPQFIEYILRWALDKDLIEYVENHNSMSFKALDAHSDEDIIPRELSSIVLAAFNNLSPILWDALKIASCIGYSFDADVYNTLTGDLDFIPKIKRLASSYDAFEKCDGNRYKWKHQAVYEAVKSLLINSQRQKIHSMIVEVFERSVDTDLCGEGKGDTHRLLARHCSLAEKWDSAFNQYMEAGKRAEEIYSFTEATRMYEEALNMQDKMTPKPLLRSQLLPTVKLGNCLRELARYEESEKVLTECLAKTERTMSEIDGDEQMYVHVLTSLATLYQNKSKYKDAKELYEKALPIARNIQESRSSLWLAGQIAGYAEILRKSGDLESAEALHREALDIRNLAFEEGSGTELELAISFTQLGCTLFGLKRYSEAYSKHRMALFSRFKYLDFSHGLVSESLNYCAESLCSLDRGCEGIPLAMHAVRIRKVVFGTSHPAYAHALSVLASCYYAAGRSCDARDFLDECIDICETAFPKNHANMIPNLMNYGKVLRSTGDLRKARDVFERAITIHQINFKEGQRAAELEKCTQEVSAINAEIVAEAGECKAKEQKSPAELAIANSSQNVDIFSKGSPIIVVTDIGRDVDDEYCLVLLSALKRMHLLNPIAVITTLAPEEKRAHLARGVLDSLGLPGVPVGVGSAGGVAEGVELEVYPADYARPCCSCVVKDGIQLMVEGLQASPDKSVQLLVIAAFTDVSTLMQKHEKLFLQKVKELVVMGGLKPLDDASEFVKPDTAYNNNCDMEAASYVYQRCQELRIPTLTISRYAAYGCPISVAVLESLCETEHMVAHNIRLVSIGSINSLWKKVNYAEDDPRREKLPARCDRTWFCRTFFGTDDTDKNSEESIWSLLENLNMYDPLALMACIPAYRETNFLWDTKYVNGTPHSIAGVSQTQNGIIDATGMSDEMAAIFGLGFRNSMQNICQ